MTKIVIFGATGRLGSRVATEATSRGHEVTAVVRSSTELSTASNAVIGDSTSPEFVRDLSRDADALVSTVGGPDKTIYVRTAQTLVETLTPFGDIGPRIIHSGGAGSLLDAGGHRIVDSPTFTPSFRDEALGQSAALDYYRNSNSVTWTYISPALNFAPGERLGHYRTGDDHPVFDEHGLSSISFEDYAIALIDEIERPSHLDTRFTVGY
jgi:hypothetical protein